MNEQFMQATLDGPRSTELAQALASGDPQVSGETTVDDVRCQGTLCRILARHDSPEAARSFIEMLHQRTETRGHRVAVLHPQDDDGLSTVIYIGESESSDI